MIWKLIEKLFRRRIEAIRKEAYDAGWDDGMAKGYELGFMMGRCEKTNRGFIIGSKADEELNQILREKGVI